MRYHPLSDNIPSIFSPRPCIKAHTSKKGGFLNKFHCDISMDASLGDCFLHVVETVSFEVRRGGGASTRVIARYGIDMLAHTTEWTCGINLALSARLACRGARWMPRSGGGGSPKETGRSAGALRSRCVFFLRYLSSALSIFFSANRYVKSSRAGGTCSRQAAIPLKMRTVYVLIVNASVLKGLPVSDIG